MGTTWDHPELGRFAHDGNRWTKAVTAPGFDVFAYVSGLGRGGQYELAFDAADENDAPSEAMIVLATRVLANQGALARKVIDALWDDFNGRGPYTGMWWHGCLDEVAEGIPPLEGPEDLHKVMRLGAIVVRRAGRGSDAPLVELSFEAAFEEEHGVGVLTDGEKVVGTGYSHDVRPFR